MSLDKKSNPSSSALNTPTPGTPPGGEAATKQRYKPALGDLVTHTVNVRLMHTLERVAAAFNQAKVPVMVLKGAALNLAIYQRPQDRPMVDLDLLIRTADIDQAFALLNELGFRRNQTFMREDFFPRFYYEVEFASGNIFPVTIDLHVRPLRPVQFLKHLPDDCLWQRAKTVPIGEASVQVPSTEDMLIHLTAHSAVHGHARHRWLKDIQLWVEAHRDEIDWPRFVEAAAGWHLSLPVYEGLWHTQQAFNSQVVPSWVMERLARTRTSWLDRLALKQAPRDNAHPVAHVLVNLLCAPSWRFRGSYLWAALVPDRDHMLEWYPYRHLGWLQVAHLCRWLGPVTALFPPIRRLISKIEVKKRTGGRIGLFATTDIKTGQVVLRLARESSGLSAADTPGAGMMTALARSDRPNAEWDGDKLLAIKPIRAGSLITVNDLNRHL